MLFLLQFDNSNLLFALQNGERSVLNTDLHYFYCWYCLFKNQFIWTPTGINYSVELVMKTPRTKHEIQRDRLPMYKAAASSNLKTNDGSLYCVVFQESFQGMWGSIYSQSSRAQHMSQWAQAKVANTTAVTSHVLSLRAFSVSPGRQDVLSAPAIRFTFHTGPQGDL